jgi:hypothetical protein
VRFRRKPVEVDAVQWFKDGDHPAVTSFPRREGICRQCEKPRNNHGELNFYLVCPGSWIITELNGEVNPCTPDIFNRLYESVEEDLR